MKIGVYSRKSKITETGDSIENQIKICCQYARDHFGVNQEDIFIYEDEGYSGGNVKRPQLLKMMDDIQKKRFDVLVCYRLDRVSRSISDFTRLIDTLEAKQIGFVSIREQFDTSTPMGRAMMYIASVFAQLERDTIAERIRDNLLELAKEGRYVSGKAPYGYRVIKAYDTDGKGNRKQQNRLAVNEQEALLVREIYEAYAQWQSVKKIAADLQEKGVLNRNGKAFNAMAIRRILTHPVYVQADEKVYRYFTEKGCQIHSPVALFDGAFGVGTFRRTREKGNSVVGNAPQAWIVTVGNHQPLLSSALWLEVQENIQGGKSKVTQCGRKGRGLLAGLLFCGCCGSPMRAFSVSGSRFYYVCINKEASKKTMCQVKNIRGDLLDREIARELVQATFHLPSLKKAFLAGECGREWENTHNGLQKKWQENKNKIERLVEKLSYFQEPGIDRYIMEQMKVLVKKNQEIESNLAEKEKDGVWDKDIAAKVSCIYQQEIEGLPVGKIVEQCIDKVVWNGQEATVYLKE